MKEVWYSWTLHIGFRIIWSDFSIHESRGIAYWGEFELKSKKHHSLQKFSLTTSHYFAHILRYTYWIEVIQVALETRFKELRNGRSHASFQCLKLKIKPREVSPLVQEPKPAPYGFLRLLLMRFCFAQWIPSVLWSWDCCAICLLIFLILYTQKHVFLSHFWRKI